MSSAPTLTAPPLATSSRSPLTRRQSLRLFAAEAVTAIGTFGLAALVIVTVPGARAIAAVGSAS